MSKRPVLHTLSFSLFSLLATSCGVGVDSVSQADQSDRPYTLEVEGINESNHQYEAFLVCGDQKKPASFVRRVAGVEFARGDFDPNARCHIEAHVKSGDLRQFIWRAKRNGQPVPGLVYVSALLPTVEGGAEDDDPTEVMFYRTYALQAVKIDEALAKDGKATKEPANKATPSNDLANKPASMNEVVNKPTPTNEPANKPAAPATPTQPSQTQSNSGSSDKS